MSHKLTEEEKEKQRRVDLERLRQQTLENNKSFDPRLIRRPSVQLYSPTVTPDLVMPATKEPEGSSAAVQPKVEAGQAIEKSRLNSFALRSLPPRRRKESKQRRG